MILKKPLSARIMSWLLWALMAVDLYLVASLFWKFPVYYLHFYGVDVIDAAGNMLLDGILLKIFLVLFGLLGLWIIIELQLLLSSIPRDPFVLSTCFGLRRIGCAAIICALVLFIKGLMIPTLLTTVCAIIMAIASLFCFTLAALFRQAAVYKQEVDLTI